MPFPALRMWRQLPRYVAGASCTWIGAAACYNLAHPLNVVWDLDETLISSDEKPVKKPVPGKEHIIKFSPPAEIEHIDDDGLHFVTTARPYALLVLKLLHVLPGCRQFVSTSASLGYMDNVLVLLDPGSKIFSIASAGKSSRGKDVFDTIPPGCDRQLQRTVLVDNKASCHRPQPFNGIVVTDFVHPSRELILTEADGKEVGRFHAASSGAFPASRIANLAYAERRSRPLRELATEASANGASALLVSDPKREQSCFPFDSDSLAVPVISVGAAAGRAWKDHAQPLQASVRERRDYELLKVLGKLLLCWLLPDVHWVIRSDSSASTV
eukprot:TRINITY_DN49919_c0_g1_i1.p1 TRINITY_DN49919_c0_g1~~TRINITY_DN49919_c0_g1_i1.p1  ORF type:complete len:346 (+),score=68.89 TRINITY_DN49919_c0_g1_i1:58-1038(+)